MKQDEIYALCDAMMTAEASGDYATSFAISNKLESF